MTVIPAFAEVPPPALSKTLPPEEWASCIELWILLAGLHLKLPQVAWNKSLEKEDGNLTNFLNSYFLALSTGDTNQTLSSGKSANELKRLCFLLAHRALSSPRPPSILLSWEFLEALCRIFPRSSELKTLLASVWKKEKAQTSDAQYQSAKKEIIQIIEKNDTQAAGTAYRKAIPLLHQMPDIAAFFLTGSDLLDAVDASYSKQTSENQKSATLFVYLGFLGLLTCSQPTVSTFSDHLYALKSASKPGKPSLLADLATNTPLSQRVQESLKEQDVARMRKLESILNDFRLHDKYTSGRRPVQRKTSVLKGKDKAEYGHDRRASGNLHIHHMSLISQIQDLFPDLGSGFVARLLDEYAENVEQVTAHLLDESLPPHLQGIDHGEELPTTNATETAEPASHLAPRSTPPLIERRNVYDDDELDQLSLDTSRLHFGRANKDHTADRMLSDRSNAPSNAAILSALAAFDSDDDERDDTYDVEDVGGTVDSTVAGGDDEADSDKHEEALFAAYRSNPQLFARDAATRRSKARLSLKSETGMIDETIEGWAIMLARDPRKSRRLEAKYATFTGQQVGLERTAYRESNTDGEDSGAGEGSGTPFRGRGRGRGFRDGGRGRGGSVAGPADEAATQQARHRKEASKGSRANHNRRDQRARKMARGGFAA